MAKKTKTVQPVAEAPVQEAPVASAPAQETPTQRDLAIINPIWMDYYYENTGSGAMTYTLLVDGVEVFSGIAQPKPGETYAKVKINDIIANYLSQRFPFNDAVGVMSAKGLIKDVTIRTNITGSFVETIGLFMMDYSYDSSVGFEVDPMVSFPINHKFAPGQKLLFTAVGEGQTVTWSFFKADGTEDRFSEVLKTKAKNFSLAIPADVERIVLNNTVTYEKSRDCERYVLYYLNAFGGWDSFVLGGRVIRTDQINRKTYKVVYNNKHSVNRGESNYMNEITRTMELHSGLLTGDAGQRMHHLLESTMVYLQDLEGSELIPVIITDTDCKFKTYGNNGNQLYDYTINVKVARDYMRK